MSLPDETTTRSAAPRRRYLSCLSPCVRGELQAGLRDASEPTIRASHSFLRSLDVGTFAHRGREPSQLRLAASVKRSTSSASLDGLYRSVPFGTGFIEQTVGSTFVVFHRHQRATASDTLVVILRLIM